MKKHTYLLVILLANFFLQRSFSQNKEIAKVKIEDLQSKRAGITNAEREALKVKVERINMQMERGEITEQAADEQKKEVAELHAANIEDRLAILDKSIALLRRNNNLVYEVIEGNGRRFKLGFGHKNVNDERLFGVRYKRKNPKPFKYDIRTYSDFVISVGNNHLLGKNSIFNVGFPSEDWFFELGWLWRYRLNKDNNALRLHYGISFQQNRFERATLLFEPRLNSFGDSSNGIMVLDPNDYVISKSRLTTRSFLLPFHLEMGPSKMRRTESSIRYSLRNKFRLGIGGYLGYNLGLEQAIEATLVGDDESQQIGRAFDVQGGLQEDNFIYGLSAYIGAGSFLFYTKLDLNTLYSFENNKYKVATVGLRIDM